MVTLIEAQARRRGAVLVTRTVQDFQRVSGLSVENWEDLSSA
jgi:predicted nucleic acid-binding protein